MKSILLTSLVFLLFNPLSCEKAKSTKTKSGTSKVNEKNIERYNPFNFLGEYEMQGTVRYNDESIIDEDLSVRASIVKCGPYEYTTVSSSNSENCFEFEYSGKSSIFLGRAKARMTFYDDGFVTVNNEYTYTFDAKKAASLFNFASNKVFTYYEERRNAEKAANDILATFDLNYALNEISAMENMDFVFWFYPSEETHNQYYADLKDDGTIANILVNATYTETDRDFGSATLTNEIRISVQRENGFYWSFALSESKELVKIYASVTDSFQRSYKFEKVYKISRTTAQSVIDKAIELRDIDFANGDWSWNN